MKAIIGALALTFCGAGAANANVVFTFSNVTFSSTPGGLANDGTLSGTFTTNDALSSILSFDITASAAGSFTGFEYTPLDASVTASSLPSQYFRIDSTGNIDELQIVFSSGLTSAGGTILSRSSDEHEPSGGNRYPSGTVVPATSGVPEPASWALMIAGFGAIGTALRGRRKAALRLA